MSRLKVKGTKKNYKYECDTCGVTIASVLDMDFKCPVCSNLMLSNSKNLLSVFTKFYKGLNKKEKAYINFSSNSDKHTIYNVVISVPGKKEGNVVYPTLVDFKKYFNLIEKMCTFFKDNDFKLDVSQFFYLSYYDCNIEFSFTCHFHLNEYESKDILVTTIDTHGEFDVNKASINSLNKCPLCKEYIFKELNSHKLDTLYHKEWAETAIKKYNKELKFLNKLCVGKEEE